jgi:predicted KAP-like P-loop ATPase
LPSGIVGVLAYRQVVTAEERETPNPPEHGYLQSDEPILRRSEDRLNRARLAEAIADQVIYSPAGQGFVIAVDGPWGSGKTSVLNMIEESIEERSETVILRFNPWLFSGTEQLVVRFLHELSVQLGEEAEEAHDERLRSVAERLGRYGEVLVPLGWVPVVGPWLARAGGLAKVVGRSRKLEPPPSVIARQQAVKAALAELDRRVVVIVDDLDRVESDQIRDVVRLIKLVADFPNVTYVLAYESEKVAAALGQDVDEGRQYLEKIVQVTHDLPETHDWPLVELLQTELQAALDLIEHGPFDHDDWVNVFHTSMRPFFKNVRDVRRYLNAVPVTLRVLGQEVALVDALALETLRIFASAAYVKLPSLVTTLTGEGQSDWGSHSHEREEAEGRAITELVEAARPHDDATREMLRRLFPRIGRHVGGSTISGGRQEYRRKRRVADPDVLRIYLQRALPEGATPAQLVQDAYETMGDRERFTELLDSVDAEQLETLLGRLEDYEREYHPATAEVATEVLINQMPRLRENTRGMMDFGAHFAVTRVVLRVFQRVEDESERTAIVKRVLPRIEQLSGREELIDLVGHRENTGHGLIPEHEAVELYRRQNEQVLAAAPDVLARERQLARLFYRVTEYEDGVHRVRIRELCEDDGVLLRLLRSSYSEQRSQTVGDLAVRSTPTLYWPGLAEMVGDEERLTQRVTELAGRVDRAQLDERTRLALETAERYASGELPVRDDRF